MIHSARPLVARCRWFALVLCCGATVAVWPARADDPTTLADAPPLDAKPLPAITRIDLLGVEHTTTDWGRHPAVVLVFLGSECPVSNGYSPELTRLAEAFAKRGVVLYGVHSDPTLATTDAVAHATEYGLTFPILLDADQQLARACGARTMPETVVVSKDGKLVYRGRIDDRYATSGKRRDEPTTHDLAAAVDAVLAGKTPAVSQTKVFGCPLPKPKSAK
jgi:peroxiredoxin